MRVGSVYDHAPKHVCDEVEQALKDVDPNCPEEEELFVEPPDVAVNGH